MTTRVPGLVFLGLAAMASAQLGCGSKKGLGPDGAAGSPDGSTEGPGGEAPSCAGQPFTCVQGGPRGTGVACGDFGMEAKCTGGKWTCPQGMVDTSDCTCGAPGVAGCTICTAQGWACPDASVDVGDARSDVGPTPIDGARCGHANGASATVVVHQPNGDELSCSHHPDGGVGFPSPIVWTGKVTGSDATSVTIEVCGGAADAGCAPGTLRVEAKAPGLDLTRFPKVSVRVRAAMNYFYQCAQVVEITTADATDGSAPAGKLLLAVSDGISAVFSGAPYKVDLVPLGCWTAKACGAPAPDDYAFDFSDAGGASAPLRLYMGETATWTNGGTAFTVRNLRSWQSNACDDYWNWAYTIYVDPK